jgi:ribonuclease P protein component
MESEYAEENLSTKQPKACEKARFSRKDGDQKRSGRPQASPRERPQETDRTSLLSFGLPKESRIARRSDFLRVYEQGTRIEGRFMTVFILPTKKPLHRLGVTATKKAVGKAHDRNRVKRLLRESFRLSGTELNSVETKYDWVLNARRSLVYAKLAKPLAEFRAIVNTVQKGEFQLPQRTPERS